MRTSWGEWHTIAEREAAKAYGRRHAGFYSVRRYAPVYLALAAVGVAGYGVWWVWRQLMAHLGSAGPDTLPGTVAHSGVPAWVLVAALPLTFVTVWLFHPGRIDQLSVWLLKWTLVPAAWLFLVGFAVSSALG